jgi:hypothetical protein
MDNLHAIQKPKLVRDGVKTRYNRLGNCVGQYEGDKVWRYRPTPKKGDIVQAPILMEGPTKGSNPNKLCSIEDTAEPLIEAGVGTSGPARTLSGHL